MTIWLIAEMVEWLEIVYRKASDSEKREPLLNYVEELLKRSKEAKQCSSYKKQRELFGGGQNFGQSYVRESREDAKDAKADGK